MLNIANLNNIYFQNVNFLRTLYFDQIKKIFIYFLLNKRTVK